MPLLLCHGDLLSAPAEALVNPVNTVGVMGKGMALQFRDRFPENYAAYRAACKAGDVRLGEMFVFDRGGLAAESGPRYIVNFPTKAHWKTRSQMAWIEDGLRALVQEIAARGIGSVAVPPLGSGNGGLPWPAVRARIEAAFAGVEGVQVQLYAPHDSAEATVRDVRTARPPMTRARALLVGAMERYARPGYSLSMLEVQKLEYFLQAAGEPLRLAFRKDRYGPYAETVHHVLQRLEGHYLNGYGDRATQRPALRLAEHAAEEARAFLDASPEGAATLGRVQALIEGFETPYGLELLSTVHWLMAHEQADTPEAAWAGVERWSERKAATFQPRHVAAAWQRLREGAWA